MDKIVDGLYLGDIRAASNLFLLKQHVSCGLLKIAGCYPRTLSFIRTESLLPKRNKIQGLECHGRSMGEPYQTLHRNQ